MSRFPQNCFRAALLAFLCACASQVFAQYTYYTFAYPDSAVMQAWSINRSYQVPGNADLSGATPRSVGFIYDYTKGTFSTLPSVAAGIGSLAGGLNDLGQVIGSFVDGSSGTASAGFIYEGSSFKSFIHPGSPDTQPRGINNAGLVTGISSGIGTTNVPWIFNTLTNSFTDLAIPGEFIIIQGINAGRTIVGSTARNAPNALFSGSDRRNYGIVRYSDGAITRFRINGLPTNARSINDNGLVAGVVFDIDGSSKGFVAAVPRAVGYTDVSIDPSTYIVVPGYANTAAQGINNAGYVSGFASDASGNPVVGFVAAPPADAQVSSLIAVVNTLNLAKGAAQSLGAKLNAVQSAIAAGNSNAACGSLGAMEHYVSAQSGKSLSGSEATQISADVAAIKKSVGC